MSNDVQIDLELLQEQITDLLNSNCDEESKEGLHNFLGTIYDHVSTTQECLVYE